MSAIPEWECFQAVRRRLDPEGRFANAYTDRVLGAISQPAGGGGVGCPAPMRPAAKLAHADDPA